MGPFDLLGLPAGATQADARAAYLRLAATHHPDKGGDAASFSGLAQAYRDVVEFLGQPRRCPKCGGSGEESTGVGFLFVVRRCSACDGTGVQNGDEESSKG